MVALVGIAIAFIPARTAAQTACPAPDERPLDLITRIFVGPDHQPVREQASLPTFTADEIRPLVDPEDGRVCGQLMEVVDSVEPPGERAWHASLFAAGDRYVIVRWIPESPGERQGRGPTEVKTARTTVVYLLDSDFKTLASLAI